MKIFYAMPFSGKTYEQIIKERKELHEIARSFGLELLEQFINVEEKEKFEAHTYEPLFIIEKDFRLINQADIIVADYSKDSIGRNCEVSAAKEVFDKRCVAVVPDEYMKRHPWIRLYNDYIVTTPQEAFALIKRLSSFNLSLEVSRLSREQKDSIDSRVDCLINNSGLQSVVELLPTELKKRWQILSEEYDTLINYSFKKIPKTLRVNILKTNMERFFEMAKKYSWELTPLSFSPVAFRLPVQTQPFFGDFPEHEEGLFYVQEVASMLPVIALNPRSGERVLEIAAAPGSKTTQMAQLMANNGEILANDISEDRLEVLKKAVQRLGIRIVQFNLGDGSVLGQAYPEKFDKVLVDAPCSCEGIIRYKPHKFFEWNLALIYRLSRIQTNLLESGFKALKPGGELVYSTCSYAPEENEAIVDSLLKKYPSADILAIKFEGIKVREGLSRWGHFDFDSRLRLAARIYPQDNDTIGFFVAKIIKKKETA